MSNTPATITHLHETHATVWYRVGADIKCFEGWVTLTTNRRRVIARKYRGRNRYLLCYTQDVTNATEVNR